MSPHSIIYKSKMKFLIILLSIFLILTNIKYIESKKTLRFLFELFRHGARSPLALTKDHNDIFNNNWKGSGELTEVGMRMHFLLGYRNRDTYAKKLNINKFVSKDIVIRSTVLNRTIESAYSHLTGFFPPGTGEVLTENQIKNAYPPFNNTFDFSQEIKNLQNNALPENSNVFPIDNIIQKNEKNFYLHEHSVCKGVNDLWENRNDFEAFKNFTKNVQHKYLNRIYKIIKKSPEEYNLNDYDNCHDLYDSFACGYYDGRSFETITENNMTIAEFKKIADEFLFLDSFYGSVPGEYVGLISMSPLMRSILEKMENRINIDTENSLNFQEDFFYSSENPKMFLFSGHDTDIGSLMHFMRNVFGTDLIYPKFAASVYLELEYDDQKKDNNWAVNFIYNDDLLFSMDYDVFRHKIENKLVDENYIKTFCDDKKSNPFFTVNIILGSTSVVLIITLIYLSVTKK